MAKESAKFPMVSIITPMPRIDADARKCIEECKKLDYPNFEIIIVPDTKQEDLGTKVKQVCVVTKKPTVKRNAGARRAKGELLAFIDSDAYPVENSWLSKAVKYFEDQSIGAVGGPNLTNPQDSFSQKVSGDILSSFVGAGPMNVRHAEKPARFVDALPCVNLILRKQVFFKIGGFDESLATGEDIQLCHDIIKSGKKIFYDPKIRVFHHRRKMWWPHLYQLYTYGLGTASATRKGRFDRVFLLKIIPSLWALFLLFGGIACFLLPKLALLYLGIIAFYLIVVLAAALLQNVSRAPFTFLGIILTHIFYGAGFISGLLFGQKRN